LNILSLLLKQEAIHAGGNSYPPFKNGGNSMNRIGILPICKINRNCSIGLGFSPFSQIKNNQLALAK